MADQSKFSNNPFAGLDAGSYPKKSAAGRVAEELVKQARKARKAVPPEVRRESELFLSAMEGVEQQAPRGRAARGMAPRETKLPGTGGFAMAEQCGLPGASPLKPSRAERRREARLHRQELAARAGEGRAGAGTGAEEDMDMAALLREEGADPAFAKAMQGVKPLSATGREVNPAVEPRTAAPEPGNNPLQDLLDGKLEFALSFTEEYCEGYVVGLDQLTVGKLRQGAFSPEASIDLHGLNVQQAFESLRGFFKSSWYRGMRCVIVVPGRGRNSPDGIGILREKLKLWFTQEPFKRVVLAFCTARPHDGGPGSLYVLLRKYKKKGRVYWDRMPADEDLF
jgi:DNA-nicking Smr family endonuclease